jgi:hypothetical protein
MPNVNKVLLVVIVALIGTVRVEAMEPAMDIYIENPLQPIIHGVTSLPDGSELMLTIIRPASGYMAQAKMTVNAGSFSTEQFSADHRPLNPGRYKIEISMSFASLQPNHVQAVIGDHGQKMTGKYVSRQFGEATFDFVKEVQLGGPANAILDAAAKAQSIVDLRKWMAESCASNVHFINAVVLAGPTPDQVLVGAKRQAYIDACKNEATNRPIK